MRRLTQVPNVRRPERHGHWYRDHEGVWTTEKYEAESLSYIFPFANITENSPDTIASATWDASGVTLSAQGLNSPSNGNLTQTVTGIGEATVTVTWTGGQVSKEKFRFRGIDSLSDDYR